MAAVQLTAQHLRLRMHPQDLALIETGAGEDLRARHVLLLADPALSRGGCVVETNMGEVDARVEARWQQAAGVFGLPLAWDLPATPPPARAAEAAPREPEATSRPEEAGTAEPTEEAQAALPDLGQEATP
ncbi:MAG: hypothetical protein C4K60_09075 [Ideonella sp. MAG2]|nr:MAG: hypothetical protein C4K60_09075 [Ideonella sp. MAG2]